MHSSNILVAHSCCTPPPFYVPRTMNLLCQLKVLPCQVPPQLSRRYPTRTSMFIPEQPQQRSAESVYFCSTSSSSRNYWNKTVNVNITWTLHLQGIQYSSRWSSTPEGGSSVHVSIDKEEVIYFSFIPLKNLNSCLQNYTFSFNDLPRIGGMTQKCI